MQNKKYFCLFHIFHIFLWLVERIYVSIYPTKVGIRAKNDEIQRCWHGTIEILREIIESLQDTVEIFDITYKLHTASSTISCLFFSPIIAGRPDARNTANRGTHACMHARDRYISRSITGTLRRSLVPFSGLRSFRPGGQVWATTPTRPFLFLWEKKNKREESHDPTVQTRPQASRFKSDRKVCGFYMRVRAPTLVCVRRLVRRWNAPVHSATRTDGFVFAIWRLVPRAVAAALLRYQSCILRRQDDDPHESGLICPNRIPSVVTVREIEIKETSVVCH